MIETGIEIKWTTMTQMRKSDNGKYDPAKAYKIPSKSTTTNNYKTWEIKILMKWIFRPKQNKTALTYYDGW